MKITIKEIAKEANVSIATVSMVINKKDQNIT
ncbi:MAG: Bacterial regulatory protein lacI family, partial [Sedimentibacter sp.]|nr:Bacterial regulatory protein lacI family [Sedimentibacter sp.]